MYEKNLLRSKILEPNISNKGSIQMHVHEFYGSTALGAPQGRAELLHNHRFAGISGPAIQTAKGHIHELMAGTDFYFNHYHFIKMYTGLPIPVYDDDGKQIGHIHSFLGITTVNFMHDHKFKGTTLIEDPIFFKK